MSISKSYAELVSDAQSMYTALEANLETLKKRGMSDEFITLLSNSILGTINLNSKQERIKGELKITTSEFNASKKLLQTQMSEAIKVVKMEIPQEKWIEFGITDKR